MIIIITTKLTFCHEEIYECASDTPDGLGKECLKEGCPVELSMPGLAKLNYTIKSEFTYLAI